jgi:signal transduction histidine kinase
VTTRLLPAATVLLALSIAASLAVLPPAALISYLALRRTTRRLEQLAAGAEALRAGDLAARVPVGGQDEVAQLQATFNAMAVDLERTLRDLEAERDRVAGLLEARRQLVASVSHELRTPVATVRGYLESIRRRSEAVTAGPPASSGAALSEANGQGLNETTGNGQALWADLETIEREIARLQRIIEDLFTLSRAEVGRLDLRPEPTDAGALVRRLVESIAPLAWGQRRVEVLAEVAPGLPPARVDAQRLEQIVSNLLGNAVRHTPPGGLVAASASVEPNAVRVEVRDTGEGIAPDELPRVFERFYRGQGSDGRAGAGLGLALVKELAEAMGGSAEAASTPGEGSRFTVRLPRA